MHNQEKEFYVECPTSLSFPLAVPRYHEAEDGKPGGITMHMVVDVHYMDVLLDEFIPNDGAKYKRTRNPEDKLKLEQALTLYAQLWMAKQLGLSELPVRTIPAGWTVVDGDGNAAELPADALDYCSGCHEKKPFEEMRKVEDKTRCAECRENTEKPDTERT